MARSNAWEGLDCRPLEPPWGPALELFRFAGAQAPSAGTVNAGWGAWAGSRLSGALLLERAGPAAMLHGPVVIAPDGVPADAGPEVAARLVGEAVGHAGATGLETVFARPLSLDRVWVRLGFIPVPESELPRAFQGRPGLGLYGWRGGSALWSSAGRGAPRSRALDER